MIIAESQESHHRAILFQAIVHPECGGHRPRGETVRRAAMTATPIASSAASIFRSISKFQLVTAQGVRGFMVAIVPAPAILILRSRQVPGRMLALALGLSGM
jgi:hypothetical protein